MIRYLALGVGWTAISAGFVTVVEVNYGLWCLAVFFPLFVYSHFMSRTLFKAQA